MSQSIAPFFTEYHQRTVLSNIQFSKIRFRLLDIPIIQHTVIAAGVDLQCVCTDIAVLRQRHLARILTEPCVHAFRYAFLRIF